jgi:hypothetical protein
MKYRLFLLSTEKPFITTFYKSFNVLYVFLYSYKGKGIRFYQRTIKFKSWKSKIMLYKKKKFQNQIIMSQKENNLKITF